MITFKHYIDTRMDEVEKQLDRRIRAVEREGEFQNEALKRELSVSIDTQKVARDKAQETIDRRLESMNAFRGALSDQQATFLTTERFDVQHEGIQRRIGLIENWQANILGRTVVIGAILLILLTVAVGWGFHLLGGIMLAHALLL